MLHAACLLPACLPAERPGGTKSSAAVSTLLPHEHACSCMRGRRALTLHSTPGRQPPGRHAPPGLPGRGPEATQITHFGTHRPDLHRQLRGRRSSAIAQSSELICTSSYRHACHVCRPPPRARRDLPNAEDSGARARYAGVCTVRSVAHVHAVSRWSDGMSDVMHRRCCSS